MGGNVTVVLRNETSNETVPTFQRKKVEFIPPIRGPQSLLASQIEMVFLFIIVGLSLKMNIIMTILLQRKFKSLPWVMLQNIVIADMMGPILTAPLFLVGLIFDQNGIVVPSLCNIQGFFHAVFGAVFLNTISMIFISRFLALFKPDLYHRIFPNTLIVRLLSLMIWSVSIAICAPPMNRSMTWGTYDKLDMTCWLAWRPKDDISMSYNALVTLATLGLAFISSLLAATVIFTPKKICPAGEQIPPPPFTVQQVGTQIPEKAVIVRLNTDVFFIAVAMFALYLVLWVPLTVMDRYFLEDWRDVNYRVIIVFIYLFIGRSVLHPSLFFVISKDIRKEAVDLFFRCRCYNTRTSSNNNIEL